MQSGIDAGAPLSDYASVAIGGVLIVFGMWWLYFDHDGEERLRGADGARSKRVVFDWGYGHFVIFAAAAAVGAGLAVNSERELDHVALSRTGVGLALTVPIALCLLCMWVLHDQFHRSLGPRACVLPAGALLVLATAWTGRPALLGGLVVVALVGLALVMGWSRPAENG